MIIAAELHFAASLLLYASRAPACTPLGVAWTVYGREWLQLFVLRVFWQVNCSKPSPPNADAELIAATKEPIGALSKPSEDAYRRQAAVFRRLGLTSSQSAGFTRDFARAKNRALVITQAGEGTGVLTLLPATAAAVFRANKAPERELSPPVKHNLQKTRARHRIRAY